MSVDNTDVKYTLILEGIDRLESGMKNAKHHTDALGESMGHLKGMVLEVVGAYVGFEVLKESLGEWEKHKVAVAELSQMYANNSDHIKMNVDELKELAEQTQHLTGIHSEEAMAAETNFMKYKDLKISYEELIPLAADMGMKLGGIESASNMLGRALENPQKAMRLLVQAGVSPQQQKMYENLAKTGHAAQAQAYLIDLLKEKYQGLAKAAFDADPTAQLAEGFKQVKESIGEFLEKGLIAIMPYLKSLMEGIKELFGFLQNHTTLLKTIGILITGIGVAMAYSKIQAFFLGNELLVYAAKQGIVTGATTLWTEAQVALNLAMEANPIGAIIIAITALVGVIYMAKKAADELKASFKKSADESLSSATKALNAERDILKEKMKFSEKEAEAMALATQKKIALKEYESAYLAALEVKNKTNWYGAPTDELIEAQKRAVSALSTYQNLSKYNASQTLFKDTKKTTEEKENPLTIKSNSDKVSGTKQVIINVQINKLVETIKIEAQNIKDGVNSAGSDVARALLDAVNQFSASTDI